MRLKRKFDILLSLTGLVILFLPLSIAAFLVWMQDGHSPFYLSERVSDKSKSFKMYKIRSMIVRADILGLEYSGSNDYRITRLGSYLRKYKIDELPQLLNILKNEMSFVGPRPRTPNEVKSFSCEEWRILSVRPGLTDIASIVFSDEDQILKDREDPKLYHDTFIKPRKNRLSIFYVDHHTFQLDLIIIILTILNIFSRKLSLKALECLLKQINADDSIISIARHDSIEII